MMKRGRFLGILITVTFLLTSAYQAFPVEAKATTQMDGEACSQEALSANEQTSIEIANLSCQELSALGSGVNKVLHEERKSGEIGKLVLARAQQLAGEAEDVGGLFSGFTGFFRKFLASLGWIKVQPPENVITLSIDSEATILAIGAVAGQWLQSLGPAGTIGAAIVAVLTEEAKWLGKEKAIRDALGDIGYFRVKKPGIGTMDVIYDKGSREACVNIHLEDLKEEWKQQYGWENEHIYMHVPFDKEPPKVRKTAGRFDYRVVFKAHAIEKTIPTLNSPLKDCIRDRKVLLGFGDDWLWTQCGNQPKKHVGVDIAATVEESVYAAHDGKVVKVYKLSSVYQWAMGIIVEHPGFITAYMHVNPLVAEGDYVSRGQRIGTIAAIEGVSHLHFGVRIGTYASISMRGALPLRHDDSDYQDGRFTGCKSDPLFPEKFIDPMTLEYSPLEQREVSISHPWPMGGHDAQNTSCSPYKGPESPNTRWLVEFDEPGISSSPLVSADGTIYLSRQNVDTTSIIAIESDGNRRELVQIPGIGRLEAIGSQRTLYAMLWQAGKGVILALDCQGRELWRSPLPSPPIEWTWLIDLIIGPDGTVYASCLDIAHDATWLLSVNSEGSKRWSQSGIRSSPAIAMDGTVYTVMHPGKICAYDGQRGKRWEYDGRSDWSGYYDRVNYSIAIGPDGTVFVLPNMLGIQDASSGRLIALTPTGVKAWHVDIPVAIGSEFEALYGPAIAPDGSLYILGSDALFKISPDGKLELFAGGDFCPNGPIVDAGGIIYVAESTYASEEQQKRTSRVIAFTPDGSEKWRTDPLDFDWIWLAAIGADGTIYARGEHWVSGQGVFQPIITIGSMLIPPLSDAPVIQSQYTLTPPVIDGILDSMEWPEPAFTKQLDYVNQGFQEKHEMIGYFMNDDHYLYIAIVITMEDFEASTTESSDIDVIEIYFDNNNNNIIEPNEDIHNFWNLRYGDWHFEENERWCSDQNTHGQGKATHSNKNTGDYIYEFKIPLNCGDVQDLSVTSGSVIGIKILYREMHCDSKTGKWEWKKNGVAEDGWPNKEGRFDGTTYGKLMLGNITGSIAWGKKVSPEFKSKVTSISTNLQINVDYLMAAMAFETGGSFDPSITNPSSGATGLIQFLPLTAQDLGTTVEALRKMNALEQLNYVEKYFTPYRGRLSTLEDVYMAILWPKAIGQTNKYVLFSKPSTEYDQNQGLDLNKDGKITKFEASAKVAEYLTRGREPQNTG